jgi:hypothetical protein
LLSVNRHRQVRPWLLHEHVDALSISILHFPTPSHKSVQNHLLFFIHFVFSKVDGKGLSVVRAFLFSLVSGKCALCGISCSCHGSTTKNVNSFKKGKKISRQWKEIGGAV